MTRTGSLRVVPYNGTGHDQVCKEAVVKRLLIVGMLVVAVALALGGCGSDDVEVDEGSVTVTTDDGTATISGGEGALAEGFPEEFPIYDDADVSSSAVGNVDGRAQYTAVLVTSDPVADVYAWYKTELPSNGWTIENDAQVSTAEGATSMLSVKRDCTARAGIIEQNDGGAEIAVTLMVQE